MSLAAGYPPYFLFSDHQCNTKKWKNIPKMGSKITKRCQGEGNKIYIICFVWFFAIRVIARTSVQNFMKKYWTAYKKQRNIHKWPPKITKIPYRIFSFSLVNIRLLSRLTVQNFIRKQTVLKKKRDIPTKRPKNTPK